MKSLAKKRPDLVAEWHPTKNGDNRPEKISCWSKEKVWWVCKKGHEWKTRVISRVYPNSGCPSCYFIRKNLPENKALIAEKLRQTTLKRYTRFFQSEDSIMGYDFYDL